MSTFILFLLLLFAVMAALFKHPKTCRTFLCLTLISFYLIGNGMLSNTIITPLESKFKNGALHSFSEKPNAIVVLGAGIIQIPGTHRIIPNFFAYSRIYEGLKLYQTCKTSGHECTLIISGGDPLSMGVSEAEIYQQELLQFQVKNSEIQIEDQSPNTYKNAELTSKNLKAQGYDRIFLVTSALHMQRALLYFSHFGIQAIPAVSDYVIPERSLLPLGYNLAITDLALHEYTGILRYHLYNFLGWNAKASHPGYP